MEDLKDKTVMVIDYGNFFPVAERLARDFGRVIYYTPWQTAFPKYHNYIIGTNVPGIERTYNMWTAFDQVDLFFFCDLYFGDFQQWLRDQGKAVFGAGRGEEMEIYRDRMKSLQRKVGLPINPYEVIRGLDGLREYLQENDDKFLKTNLMRGHFESFKHEEYSLTKPLLDEWEHTLGLYKNDEIFIVEDPIEAIAEIGYDGFAIDGVFPAKALFGIEIKDCAYCGTVVDYSKLPQALKDINAKLSDSFKEYEYRGSYTNEVRLGVDRVAYLIDQTCRQPEPPTCLQLEIFDNYSEIVWQIANGIVPTIKNKYRYGAQLVIKSDWARTEPQAIYFPQQFKNFIKIKNLVMRDGIAHYIPQPGVEMEEIGAVVGLGNTLQEAIDQVKAIAREIRGYCVSCDIQGLSKAEEEIDKLKKAGIKVF
jgi:hypothetical protein